MPNTPQEHWDYTLNEWRGGEFKNLIELLPKIDVMYDIGANSGAFSRIILDRNPDCRVYAFEPVWRNFKGLKELLPNVFSIFAGVFYGKSTSRVFWRGSNCGAFFVEHINAGNDRVDTGENMLLVELEKLGLETPDLIKLDIEGAEENVIEHSSMVKNCKYIILEWHPDHVDVFKFLKKHLPKHKILKSIENKQFLLQYES